MKLYEYRGFPNPARARIALAEKGLTDQVEFIAVDVPAGEARRSAFHAINPAGTVPALELDDGTVISECVAITEYLDHAAGEPTLTGQSARDRALIHMMQKHAEHRVLEPALTYFHHATPGLGAELETAQNPAWGLAERERAVAGMRFLDAALARRPYLAGDAFSMADITAFVGLGFAEYVKIAVSDGLAHLAAWRARVAARPSIAAA